MSKPTRYYSKKQENSIANAVSGKRQQNSGATMFKKGDIVTNNWLLEAKTKVSPSKSMTIHKEWIDKNREEAFAMGKQYSAVVFNFGDIHNAENFYIISEADFKTLLEVTDNEKFTT